MYVDDRPVVKPGARVRPAQRIDLAEPLAPWVSRGGEKLAAALAAFAIQVDGRRALDVGASTGGFTDVLVQSGASEVVALDVGRDQLAETLRTHPRIVVREGLDIRTVDPGQIGAPFDVIVVDVSFVSLTLLGEALAACGTAGTDVVALVKPQFEVGRDALPRTGVVVDPDAQVEAVVGVAAAFAAAGLGVVACTESPIVGGKGNREFFVHAVAGTQSIEVRPLIEAVVG